MSPAFNPPTAAPVTLERPTMPAIPVSVALNSGPVRVVASGSPPEVVPALTPLSRRAGIYGLVALRLAIGFEFLWAFLDKVFGLGYSTSSAHAWINGGSPTKGFLSGAKVGPLSDVFNAMAGVTVVDWLFMLGLLGVGTALILGAAIRPAAVAGSAMLLLMYLATWPNATLSAGVATRSSNPIVDDHIVMILALVVIGSLAAVVGARIGRRWAALPYVRSHPSLI